MTRASVGIPRKRVIRPIVADDTLDIFSSFASCKHILLAVSGGPDSVALLVLARDWAKLRGRQSPKLSVATVDHGLRKEARDEAALVARISKSMRVPHEVLFWRGEKPKTGIQEKARRARYDLLFAHARKIKADAIAFAHHANDQAETILLRLASGSGLAGLGGMKQTTCRNDVLILRPLLSLPAERLRATLDSRGIAYVDDPSNLDEAYARVRMRKARAVLSAEGLTPERLQTLSYRLARADDALSAAAAASFRHHRMPAEAGMLFAPTLFVEPLETVIRVLQLAVSDIGMHAEPPILSKFENLSLDLMAARAMKKSLKLTIGGALLSLSTGGRLKIVPESPRRKV